MCVIGMNKICSEIEAKLECGLYRGRVFGNGFEFRNVSVDFGGKDFDE